MSNMLAFFSWIVGIIALNYGFRGTATYRIASAVPQEQADYIDECCQSDELPTNESASLILNRFMFFSIVEIVIVLTELTLIFIFLSQNLHYFMIIAGLKNLIWIIVSIIYAKKNLRMEKENLALFARVRALPSWYLRLDRLGQFITATCFLGYFFIMTGYF